MFSCNKETLLPTDSLIDNASAFSVHPEIMLTKDMNSNSSQSLRNGSQKINLNQTDGRFIRGVDVRIPLFVEAPIDVPTGSWITSSFSLQAPFKVGPCDGPLTEEEITSFMDDAASLVETRGFDLRFDGEPIDLLSNLRPDLTVAVTNQVGNCQYILPFRYYINPQSKGEHILSLSFDDKEYSRTITWVAGKKVK